MDKPTPNRPNFINSTNDCKTLQNSLLKSMAWNVSGTILSKLLSMALFILIARMLGVDKNGEYGIINSTILMFTVFAGLGLGTTATRFVAEYKHSDQAKCGRIIGLTNLSAVVSGILIAAIFLLLSPVMAKEQLNAPHLAPVLMLSSILLATGTINSVQISTLSGFGRFKQIAWLSMIQGVLCFPLYIGFTYLYGLTGLFIGRIAVECLMVGLYEIENHKARKAHGVRFAVKGARSEIHIIWKFSAPAFLSGLVVNAAIWIGNTFLAAAPNGYFELGIFGAANQWRTVLTFLPAAVGSVILPYIIANKKDERLERINMLLGWVIVNAIAIPILACPELVAKLYGGEYTGRVFDISFLMVVLTSILLSYKEGIARNLISRNLMWWSLGSNTFWSICFLVSLWFIRGWGSIGLSVSHVFANVAVTLAFLPVYVRKGVVQKPILFCRDALLMWAALAAQAVTTAMTTSIVIRGMAAALSAFALYGVYRVMTQTGPWASYKKSQLKNTVINYDILNGSDK